MFGNKGLIRVAHAVQSGFHPHASHKRFCLMELGFGEPRGGEDVASHRSLASMLHLIVISHLSMHPD